MRVAPLQLLCFLVFGLANVLAAQAPVETRMVSVGTHELQMQSRGAGPITVLFESGFSMDLEAWRKVAPALAKNAQVVCYSRAGYGKSGISKESPSVEASLRDFERLIEKGSLKPPFILVGHSFGAHLIRGYASRHPDSVAGMVFVDPSHEGFYPGLRQMDAARFQKDQQQLAEFCPPPLKAEFAMMNTTMEQGLSPEISPLPQVPVALVTSVRQRSKPEFLMETPEGVALWRRLHETFMARFSQGLHLLTPYSSHFIQLDEPELVVEAIQYVLGRAEREASRKALNLAIQSTYQAGEKAAAEVAKGHITAAETTLLEALAKLQMPEAEFNKIGYGFLGKRGQPEVARMIFLYLCRAFPQSPNALDSHGEALLALKRPAEAKACFTQAIALAGTQNPQHPGLQGYLKNLALAEQALVAR